MKYTLITLAALSGTAFAQTYSAGDIVTFGNLNDLVSGSNGAVLTNANDSWFRAVEPDARGNLNYALNQNGSVWDYASNAASGQTASWLAGNIRDFDYDVNTGRFQVHLTGAAAGYSAGDIVTFGNLNDLVSGSNGAVLTNANDSWFRAVEPDARGNLNYALNQNGSVWDYASNAASGQTASWLAGKVRDFDYDVNTGRFQVHLTQDVNLVPEPSSAALLGLGGLALILRRRK